MIELIDNNRENLAKLCRRYRVKRLDLFGSAVAGNFDPIKSDLDFIIEFEDRRESGILERYLDFARALEELFGRHVDLLTPRSIKNPFFMDNVNRSRMNLYDRNIQAAYS